MRRKEREIISMTEIESIINSADVCRVSFAENNLPYIVTMNFGFMNGKKPRLFFHCANEGRKLEMLRKNNYVCFEMDTDHRIVKGLRGCDWSMKYRSVVGYGRIYIVNDEKERNLGLIHIMDHYGGVGPYEFDLKVMSGTTILRLDIFEMTAKSTI